MQETKQCKENECQPTKQCFETTNARKKNIYKKNENICAYICEDEEEERELKKLTLTQMECRCSRRRQTQSANAKRRQRRERKYENVCGALQNLG